MSTSQTHTAIPVFQPQISEAAWRCKPSWTVVATEDWTVSALWEHVGSTITELAASHVVYMTEPQVVAEVIVGAVEAAA